MKKSWRQENESYAHTTLLVVNHALEAYHKKFEGYPDSLRRLTDREVDRPERASPERARLLDSWRARDSVEVGGYRFRYQPGQPDQRWAATVQLFKSYRLTAEPLSPGSSGEIFYYSDQTRIIRARRGQAAGPDDPAAP
ncbi:MAG: hypothetical protein ACRD35_08305 [Candidatus Acidiferrales bacterium]